LEGRLDPEGAPDPTTERSRIRGRFSGAFRPLAGVFIEMNGWTWGHYPDVDESEHALLAVASSEWDEERTAAWLRPLLEAPRPPGQEAPPSRCSGAVSGSPNVGACPVGGPDERTINNLETDLVEHRLEEPAVLEAWSGPPE
jgi:hypothetical protein